MPDFDMPSRYLRGNFDRTDRLAVVLIDRTTGAVEQKFATAEKIASPQYQAHLRAANSHQRDVYVSMNTVAAEATGRTKADIETIRHCYLDVDVGGRAAVDRILNAPGMPRPNHALNTSPEKFQLIWSVEGFDKTNAEELLRSMASAHGADPAVTDCSRVLRVPGFRNWKYSAQHFVKDVLEETGERVYRPEDFPAYEVKRQSVRAGEHRQRFSGNGQTSQSERDWAYALRALERGESPTVIQFKIEQFRQDKPNPHYYAKRTVERAVLARTQGLSRPLTTMQRSAHESAGPDR